ncbi:MAG: hypothetical protein ACOYMG_23725 [Candidatus Methylumidiphilus sp.]
MSKSSFGVLASRIEIEASGKPEPRCRATALAERLPLLPTVYRTGQGRNHRQGQHQGQGFTVWRGPSHPPRQCDRARDALTGQQ